jgi:hypothetical protein
MINHKTILQHLADGINPLSGEIFEDNHICQNSKVTRALLEAVQLLEEQELKKSNKLPSEYKNIKHINIRDLPIEDNIDIKCEILYINNKYTIFKYLNKNYRVRTTKISPPTICGLYSINKVLYGKEKEYARLQYLLIEK